MSKTIAPGYHPVFSFNCSGTGEGFCKLSYDSYGAMVVRKALVKSNMFKENMYMGHHRIDNSQTHTGHHRIAGAQTHTRHHRIADAQTLSPLPLRILSQ